MQQIEELLAAIRSLEAQRANLGDQVVDAALGPLELKLTELEQNLQPVNQRRLVTVLFLDIYNSTAISQQLEPEEVLEIIGGTLKRLSTPITEYGGSVLQVLGDGFMAVFGLAKTHEDDARQAVRAGLAVLAEASLCADELKVRHNIHGFNIRIGINTGRVVAGRFTEVESTIMGLTVALAARMEQSAQPGSMTITGHTYQHIRGAFEVEELPPIDAKGFSKPVPAYRVISARPKTFRPFTRGVEEIETTFISRQAELEQLQSAVIDSFSQRKTQIFTITGEAGIGKSRLLHEFDRWIARSNRRVVAFKARASIQMTSTPFSLLKEMIAYHLNILTTDPTILVRQKIEDAIKTCLPDASEMKAHFIGSLLGFDFNDSPHIQPIENDPKQLNERGQLYLLQFIHAIASQNNSIIMLDDIHWADLPSVNFIDRCCRENSGLPLLIVCLARPIVDEQLPDWTRGDLFDKAPDAGLRDKPIVTTLTLKPLSWQECIELISQILGKQDTLPEVLIEKILASANGNPFYIEQFIQSLIYSGAITQDPVSKVWSVDPEKLDKVDIPSTLVALLEARLDLLTPVHKKLVQQASVVGQVFWHSALSALRMQKPIDEIEIDQLVKYGFIFPQVGSAFEGTKEYRFHHGLLRDVIYQSINKSDRRKFHGLTAAWYIEKTNERGRANEYAAIIAEHCEIGEDFDLASEWYTRAGTQAHSQGAPSQALHFFDHALSLLPPSDGNLGDALLLHRRWNALAGKDEILGILGEAEERKSADNALVELANIMGDEKLISEAAYRQGFALAESGQYQRAYKAYERGLTAARKIHDRRCEALILGVKVACEVRLGDLASAYRTTIEAMECADKLGDDQVLARTLNNISTFYTETGDLDRAIEALDRQLKINHASGNITGEVVGLSNLGYIYILLGMPEEGVRHLQDCIEKARSIGHRSFLAYGGLNLALAYFRSGELSQASSILNIYIPELKMMGDVFGSTTGEIYAAMVKENEGKIDEALAGYRNSAATFSKIGILGSAKDAEGGIARCLLKMNDLTTALSYAKSIFEYLEGERGAGMEFPILGYETCMKLFLASDESHFARIILQKGYEELMKRAGKISSPVMRKSFLECVPENRYILESWRDAEGCQTKER